MTLTLIQPAPDILKDDLAQRMASRTVRENNLRAAFAAVIERDGWTPALEALASECEEYAGEGGSWFSEIWRMRQRGLVELSDDLRGV